MCLGGEACVFRGRSLCLGGGGCSLCVWGAALCWGMQLCVEGGVELFVSGFSFVYVVQLCVRVQLCVYIWWCWHCVRVFDGVQLCVWDAVLCVI